jgi:hypothetical protein
MAKVTYTIQCRVDVDNLLSRIERLAAHVDSAAKDDPVRQLAAEIGEIDASTDIKQTTARDGDILAVTFEAHGNLAKMLAVFEARS